MPPANTSNTIASSRSCWLANINCAENQTLKKVRILASTYPLSKVQRRVGDKFTHPMRYAAYPTSVEANAVIPRNSAISPSSLEGGDISILKNASEMATINRMPNVRRASMGRRERENFINIFVITNVFCNDTGTVHQYTPILAYGARG